MGDRIIIGGGKKWLLIGLGMLIITGLVVLVVGQVVPSDPPGGIPIPEGPSFDGVPFAPGLEPEFDKNDPDKEKKLELYKLGFKVADKNNPKGVTSKDVVIKRGIATIMNSEKVIDLSDVDGLRIVLLNGGRVVDDNQNKPEGYDEDSKSDIYLGDLLTDEDYYNLYIFGEGAEINVGRGSIVLEDVELLEGSVIEGVKMGGEFEEIRLEGGDFDSAIIGKKGSIIKRGDFSFIPGEGSIRFEEGNLIADELVKIEDERGRFGSFEGVGEMHETRRAILLKNTRIVFGAGNPKRVTENSFFEANDGTIIDTSENMIISEGAFVGNFNHGENRYLEENEGKSLSEIDSSYTKLEFEPGRDLVVTPGQDPEYGNDFDRNNVEIITRDKGYKDVLVRDIDDNLMVGLTFIPESIDDQINNYGSLSRRIEITREGGLNVRGNIKGLETNIGHVMNDNGELKPFLISGGELVTINDIGVGEISSKDPLAGVGEIADDKLKGLFVRSLDFRNENLDDQFLGSLDKYLKGNGDLQDAFARSIDTVDGESFPELYIKYYDIAYENKDSRETVFKTLSDFELESIGFGDLALRMKDSQELLGRKINDYSKVFSVDDYNKIVESAGGNEFLESVVKTKTDGFIDLDGFRKLTDEREIRRAIEEANIYSSETLREALEKAQTRELQDIILEKVQLRKSSPNPADDLLKVIELTKGREGSEGILGRIYQKEVVESPYNLKEFIKTHSDEEVLRLAQIIDNERLGYVYGNKNLRELDLSPSDKLLIGLSAYREAEFATDFEDPGSKEFRGEFEKQLEELAKVRGAVGLKRLYDADYRVINIGTSPNDVEQLDSLADISGVVQEGVVKPVDRGSGVVQDFATDLSNTKKGPVVISFHGVVKDGELRLSENNPNEVLTPEVVANALIWRSIRESERGGSIDLSDAVVMINSNSEDRARAYTDSFASDLYRALNNYDGQVSKRKDNLRVQDYSFPRLKGRPIIITTEVSDDSQTKGTEINPVIKSLNSRGKKGPITVNDFLDSLGENIGAVDGYLFLYDENGEYRRIGIKSDDDIYHDERGNRNG